MGREIERKFLVCNNQWRAEVVRSTHYHQGYIVGSELASVRVRIEGKLAKLNIKSATLGIERQEYEYPIPIEDAQELLNTLCKKPQVSKTRSIVEHGGHTWEIDTFNGDNEGLIVAEVELSDPDEELQLPEWVGREVSNEPRYYNSCLIDYPYSIWNQDERGE